MFADLRSFGDLLRRNASVYPRGDALVFATTRLTWPQVNARANRLASALQKKGLRHGERVAILSRNCHQVVEVLFGVAKVGAVSVPINYRLSEAEMELICRDAGAVTLVVGPEYVSTAEKLAARAPSLREVVALGDAPRRYLQYESLLDEGEETEPLPDRPLSPEDLLLFLYTSGTTGFPKGVMYTHYRTLVGMLVHVLAIGSHAHHRVLLPAPLYSAAGIAGIFCAAYVGSASVVVNFEPKTVLETIERERISFTNLVPTTIQMLSTREDVSRYDLSSLRLLLYGGAPMPEPVVRRASEVFRCDFRQTFATSETGCSGTVLEPDDHRQALAEESRRHLLASCGRPQVNVAVRIVKSDGIEAEVGEVGEIAVLADGNMVGYWNQPEATREVLRDGWVHTGDLARRDEEGYVYLVGRKHDMIVTGAMNVYPSEVERVLEKHPAVKECAVIGVPHEVWGEAVHAVVVLKEGVTASEREILDFSTAELAGFKKPRSVLFVQALPRNPTGKVLRRLLREPYWQGRKVPS